MTTAIRAATMAVMTTARTVNLEQEGHTSLWWDATTEIQYIFGYPNLGHLNPIHGYI